MQSFSSDPYIYPFPKIPGPRSERDKQQSSVFYGSRNRVCISELAELCPDRRKLTLPRRVLGLYSLVQTTSGSYDDGEITLVNEKSSK